MKKREALQLLQELPDDIDAEDLMYRICLMHKVQATEGAIAAGDTVTHEEALRISDEWLK